jgi:hypothetical protein
MGFRARLTVGHSFLAICLNHTERVSRAGRLDMFGQRGRQKGYPPSAEQVLLSLPVDLESTWSYAITALRRDNS